MTTKKTKATIFSALILSTIISIAGMNFVDAETNDSDDSQLIVQNSTRWNSNVPTSIEAYEVTELDAMVVRQAIQNTHEFSIEFDGQTYVLNLYEFDLRSPDAKAYLRDAEGNLIEVEKEDIKTYHGYANNDKSKSVFLLASESDVAGFIKKPGGEIVIEPLRNYDMPAPISKITLSMKQK